MFGFLKRNNNSRHINNQSADSVGERPKAVAFVDFEHWYISLDKLHHTRPEIKAWRDDIAHCYDLQEIIFFADFSNESLRREIPKIRQITNYMIETQNTAAGHKKDFTDFIMLDHIYQKAASARDVDTFILFTGDGHFNSVSNYLISQLGKQVVVYGIRGAMSRQLSETASRVILLPTVTDPMVDRYRLVLSSLKKLEDSGTKKSYASFWGTTEAVSRTNGISRKETAIIVRTMLNKGYLYQNDVQVQKNKTIKTICVDWKKCRVDGIWETG